MVTRSRIDVWVERSSRGLASHIGRRSFIARLGGLLVGTAAMPLLPVARASAASSTQDADAPVPEGAEGDPTKCEYWRHCGIDGFLCSCCGGSETRCPPGTEMSPVTWVGTCRNPADDRDYLISYNDCCGKGFCGRCMCNRNQGERPDYHWFRNNDINWCAGAAVQTYHCSTAIVLGVASERQPEK
jgi:methylamine dehydrogenase light chain